MTVEMLPARYGDCIWIECLDRALTRRILIDGGPPGSYEHLRERISTLKPAERHFELLVITHVDADHIWGIMRLLEDDTLGCTFGDVWFNGFRHLPRPTEDAARSLRQGKALSELLDGTPGQPSLNWNRRFAGRAVSAPGLGRYQTVSLEWGLRVTLLSPIPARLSALWKDWDLLVQKATGGEPSEQQPHPEVEVPDFAARRGIASIEELAAAPSRKDRKAANGSSIGFLFEWGRASCILAGDSFPDVIEPAIRQLALDRGMDRLVVDAFKLPHHGSMGNVTRTLIEAVRCPRYLFSTNGEKFDHPDPEAVARVILFGGPGHSLCFNYRTPLTERWEDDKQAASYGYEARYGAAESGLVVELGDDPV